jgi:hypothetical protein
MFAAHRTVACRVQFEVNLFAKDLSARRQSSEMLESVNIVIYQHSLPFMYQVAQLGLMNS